MINLIKYKFLGKNPIFEIYFRNKKSLDIGCGQGEFIANDCNLISGIDLNERVVRQLQEKNFNVKFASATKIPYNNNEFEAVHCKNIIEHLFPEEARNMISEISRVLKNDGVLVLQTPSEHVVWSTFGHVKPYTPTAVRKLFRDKSLESFEGVSGLRMEKVVYLGKLNGRLGFIFSTFLAQFFGIFCGNYIMIIRKYA